MDALRRDLLYVEKEGINKVTWWLDVTIEFMLTALLTLAPFTYGAVEAWSEEVVLVLAGCVTTCFLIKQAVGKETTIAWTWAYAPLCLIILLGGLQLVELPCRLIALVSPGTASLKAELFDCLSGSDESLRRLSMSFHSNATRHDLRLLIAVVSVFVIVANSYRDKRKIERLLGAIAVIGCAMAVMALAQNIFGAREVKRITHLGTAAGCSGAFINHSHFGQFMNLSIGAGLGLLFVRIQEGFGGRLVTPQYAFQYIRSRQAVAIWLSGVMIIASAAAIFLSLTRGGMASMLLSGALVCAMLTRQKSLRVQSRIMIMLGIAAFAAVLYIGFEGVYERLAMVRELREADIGRWQMLKDSLRMWVRFPVVGTGLGAYEYVFPMFDSSTIGALAAFAENEYIQLAEEMGLVGIAFLIWFASSLAARFYSCIKNSNIPICYGIGFGLIAVSIHSMTDFGQHIPANGLLTAVFCGLIFAISNRTIRCKTAYKRIEVLLNRRYFRVCILLVGGAIWTWALAGADAARRAEGHWKKASQIEQELASKDWIGSDSEFVELISEARTAVKYQPDNIEYCYRLAVYRWKVLSMNSDIDMEQLITSKAGDDIVRRIIEELHNAGKLCVTYGPVFSLAGQLERMLGLSVGEKHIRQGFKLAPSNVEVCFAAGLLDAEEGLREEAELNFQRALKLNQRLFSDVAHACINKFDMPETAMSLAWNNSDWLTQLAEMFETSGKHRNYFERTCNRLIRLMQKECENPDAPASMFAKLARIYKDNGDYERAIELYKRALDRDYSQAWWRLAVANLLTKKGLVHEAIHEAKVCLRLNPEFKQARELLERLLINSREYEKELIGP